MEPLLKEVTEQYKGKATIIRINIDENSSLAKKQKIDEIPFFKYYINGEEKGNYIGELNSRNLVHTVNGTALAVPRIVLCLLETGWCEQT
jgi:hypothetical protein